MENTRKIQETNEARLFQIVVQSEKQERNHTFSDKTTVWGAHYIIKISEDTEQRIIIIQMHSIQHPQIDQSHYNIPSFLLSLSNYNLEILCFRLW